MCRNAQAHEHDFRPIGSTPSECHAGRGVPAHVAVETHRHHRPRDLAAGRRPRAALPRAGRITGLAVDRRVSGLRHAVALDLRRPQVLFLALASAAALYLVVLRCNGYEGALLALVAMRLGTRMRRLTGIVWILGQTVLLGIADAITFNPHSARLLLPPYLGLQLVAFFVFDAMAREVAARTALAASNAELRGVSQILADTGRMAERLRISQELHDALGHHLTALSLNLEAALQLTQGAAHASVATAQGLARRLLGDVREIVAESRTRDGINLADALQTLVGSVPRPQVHLDIPEGLRTPDPERAHTLLRCAQEIVTNAARHSEADNLWIRVRCEGETL